MSIVDMALAHLQTVEKAIADLENQKQAIENEIVKLTEYLAKGNQLVLENQSSDAVVN